MRRNVVGCLLAALTLSVGAVAQQKNQAEIDLQTAIRMETLGDCKGAIKRYDEILRKYRKDANVSGKAIDHMLDCYDTLSDIDVRNASQRLAREYPEHKEAIAFASARHGQGGQSAVRQRRVIDGDPSGALQFNAGASMGVDGRTLAVIDWFGSGDIAVQDVATAAIRRLKVKDGTYLGDEEGATGTWTMLSPDQSKVAFLWTPGISKYEQLRVVANAPGAKSRIVVPTNDDEIEAIEPAGWAPDGKSLYVVIRKDAETSQIAQVSVDDGRIRVVKPLDKRSGRGGGYLSGLGGGSRPAVSPDGRYIAYSALPANPDKPRSARIGFPTPPEPTGIYVTTTDGAGIEVLVTGGSGTTNQFPVWAPDGAHLLFLSDRPLNNRSGEPGLWWVEMRDGKPVGPASPAWPQLGKVFPLGMTRSGSFYYLKEQSGDDVFTIRVPARGLLDRGAAVRLSDRATNTNRDAAWSPDGRSIAFKRQRADQASNTTARMLNTDQTSDLVVRSLSSGDEKIYSQGFFERAPLIWSHDGNSILTVAQRGRAGTLTCLRLDLRSSQVTTIETTLRAGTFNENNRGIGGAVGPDNTTLYIRDWDPAGIASVVALDLTTGNKRTIWSKPVPDSRALSAPALSPDGRTLVMILKDESEKGRVIRVGIDGSGYREIASGLEGPSAPRWEGRAVLFVERRLGQFKLMRVSADGGNPEFTGLTEPDAFAFDVSPDGSNLVITEHLSNQLWAIDNLESLWKAGR